MIDKISNLYREEQSDKVRNSRKILSLQKNPDLLWKLAENPEIDEIMHTPLGPTPISIIMIISLIVNFVENYFRITRR